MKNIRNLFYLSLTASVCQLFAEEGVLSPSPRPTTQPKTIDISAQALYWYTSEGVDWAFVVRPEGNTTTATYKEFTFNWAPGFRIGLGYNMAHDTWDTQTSYTWFQAHATDHVANGEVFSGFLGGAKLSLVELINPFKTGKASIDLHYNIFDWDLGRNCLVSKNLILRPSIGLRGGWISQQIYSYWSVPDFLFSSTLKASETLKHAFQGGGPKGGLTAKWCFRNIAQHSLSIIGLFEAGYLWGHWSIHDHFIDNLDTNILIKTTPRNFGSLVIHSFLGISWDCNFDKNRSHFNAKIGYEIEDWFNQFQIYSNVSGAQNNDLILQGATLGVAFEF